MEKSPMKSKKDNVEKEVKGHLTEEDFKEFLENLGKDGLNRSEWIRQQVLQYNIAHRAMKEDSNIIKIF